ncbi:hypothetical protein MPNT_210031 [Candidatus Methylacidithermus pantelleriae]|uniref:Uncharacterized protein n=1 Tax=Candidatus Methylacidithermus pantelleriae TaxID=2744239 RepID=A0A8J2FPS6_9BACT|nr:hypothetical protein MPNT_210031 [Candidatus Methylacidithermus pantelleriae]
MTRRDPDAALTERSVSELLRDERSGIRGLVRVMNHRLDEFGGRSDFIVVRYEALRASPAEYFLSFLPCWVKRRQTLGFFKRRSISLDLRTRRSWRLRVLSIPKFFNQGTCGIRNRSKYTGERLAVIGTTFLPKISDTPRRHCETSIRGSVTIRARPQRSN